MYIHPSIQSMQRSWVPQCRTFTVSFIAIFFAGGLPTQIFICDLKGESSIISWGVEGQICSPVSTRGCSSTVPLPQILPWTPSARLKPNNWKRVAKGHTFSQELPRRYLTNWSRSHHRQPTYFATSWNHCFFFNSQCQVTHSTEEKNTTKFNDYEGCFSGWKEAGGDMSVLCFKPCVICTLLLWKCVWLFLKEYILRCL